MGVPLLEEAPCFANLLFLLLFSVKFVSLFYILAVNYNVKCHVTTLYSLTQLR